MSIYFLQEIETGFIKLGVSKNPQKRIAAIANSMGKKISDFNLIKIADGDFGEEYFYQSLLSGNHINRNIAGHNSREWFKPTDKVISMVSKDESWFKDIYRSHIDLSLKYGSRNVKFYFDGENVRCKVSGG